MEEGTTRVDDIWYVAILFTGSWAEQWLTKLAHDLGASSSGSERSADAVGAHGADPVSEHQPACVGFDGRPAVAELDDLPSTA